MARLDAQRHRQEEVEQLEALHQEQPLVEPLRIWEGQPEAVDEGREHALHTAVCMWLYYSFAAIVVFEGNCPPYNMFFDSDGNLSDRELIRRARESQGDFAYGLKAYVIRHAEIEAIEQGRLDKTSR